MKDITSGNIYKNFFLFAIPLILSGFLSQSFNVINQILSGQYLGDSGLAISGSVSGFFNFLGSVFWGYAMGFSVLLTKMYGEKDYKGIKTAIINNCLAMVVATSFASLLIIIFREQLFDMLKIAPEIREETMKYFVVYILPYSLTAFRTWGNLILISLGITSYPLWVSLLSSVLGLILKVISLGVFKLGMVSLAVNTHIVSVIIAIIYISKLKKCFKEMGVDKEKVGFSAKILKESFSLSLPTVFQQSSMNIVSFLVSPLVNSVGTFASAAYSVVSNIQNIGNTVYANSSKAVTNYCAQCVGRRKFNMIPKGVKAGIIQNFVLAVPIIILCAIFATPLSEMYFRKGSSEVSLNYCIVYVRYYNIFVIFNIINSLFHGFYRGVMAMKTVFIVSFSGALIRLIATYLSIPYFGMNGVFLGWVISWIIEAIFNVIIYFSGVWKKEKINKIIKEEGLTV